MLPQVAELFADWQRARQRIVELVEQLDDRAWARVVTDQGWTVRDVVAHLASSDELYVTILTGVHLGRLTADDARRFDLYGYNETQRAARAGRPRADLLTDLDYARARLEEALDQLTEEDLRTPFYRPPDRPGRLPPGEMTVLEMLQGWHHDREHLEQLQAALRA